MTETFDPLSFEHGYRDQLAELREQCPVSRIAERTVVPGDLRTRRRGDA